LIDPNSYRMLTVSGTMYRLCANVIRSLLATWCVFLKVRYRRCTVQLLPMFILRHLFWTHASSTWLGPPVAAWCLHHQALQFIQLLHHQALQLFQVAYSLK